MSFSRGLPRRQILLAAPMLALAAVSTARADDDYTTTDLAVSCDLAATAPLRRATVAYKSATGIRVRLYPTGTSLLLPQLSREIQNDIILTRVPVIDAAEKEGLVKPGGRIGPWRNRLVLAEASPSSAPDGTYAIPDPTPASDVDGPAVLQALGITPNKSVGVLNTDAVVWALLNGQARRGLIYQTDLVANEGLRAVATVPDTAAPPVLYAATLTSLAYRIDPGAFLKFLDSKAGRAELTAGGLEAA